MPRTTKAKARTHLRQPRGEEGPRGREKNARREQQRVLLSVCFSFVCEEEGEEERKNKVSFFLKRKEKKERENQATKKKRPNDVLLLP